jgi:hypothetical protein
MPAWDTDAGKFNPAKATKYHIFENQRIQDYLKIGDRDHQFILVGRKGLGKTLLLRRKSYLYRNHYEGDIQYNSEDSELTENLDITYNTLSREELLKFRNYALWERIWKFILSIVALRIYGLDDPWLNRMSNNSTSRISALLVEILNNRGIVEKYLGHLEELAANINQIQSGVAIFIDDVDQAFEQILKDKHSRDFVAEDGNIPAVEIWTNVQAGLVSAIYALNRQNSHIKIFATIRSEAFYNIPSANFQNYRQYATELEYTREEIQTIFTNNIQLLKDQGVAFVDEKAKDPIEQFLGIKTMPHIFAKRPNSEEKREEKPFDFIYRHTYGRPRELVQMGKTLYQNILETQKYRNSGSEDRVEMVREKINEESGKLFANYVEEIVPRFDNAEHKKFIKQIRKNVIRQDQMVGLNMAMAKTLYNLGMLGYTKQRIGEDYSEQIFLVPGRETYSPKRDLPSSKYYITHPSMDDLLIQEHTYERFYNPHNIIGDGYRFYDPEEEPEPVDNSHFYPTKVSGERWTHANSHSKHEFPLESYYQQYFSTTEPVVLALKKQLSEKADDCFEQILLSHCVNLLRQQPELDPGPQRWEQVSTQLARAEIRNRYQRRLQDPNSTSSMIDFHYRLIGRLLTIGCWMLCDLNVDQIHDLLINGIWPTDLHKTNGRTSHRYLMNAFFIDGLPNDRANRAHNRIHTKMAVYAHLSPFERATLSRWYENLAAAYHNWSWLTPPQSQYLKKKLDAVIPGF